MKRFALYLFRWQLSTPILWLVVRNLGVGIWSTIIGNLIGPSVLFRAYRPIKKLEAQGVYREQILKELTKSFGEENSDVSTRQEDK